MDSGINEPQGLVDGNMVGLLGQKWGMKEEVLLGLEMQVVKRQYG